MHRSSLERMQAFRDAYLADVRNHPLKILDVGSAAVQGSASYRDLFATKDWEYRGLDTAAAPNVDLAVKNPYHWMEIADASFDVVVSGQAFEHIEWPWLTFMEIARVLKPAGLAAITAPSSGHVHRYPTDCWRYYPDAFPALAKYSGLSLVENEVDFSYAFRENAFWGDAFAIFQKPLQSHSEGREWAKRRQAARLSAGFDDEGTEAADAVSAPFEPKISTRNALQRRLELEQGKVSGLRWRFWIVRQHLRSASRALRYPAERLRRF